MPRISRTPNASRPLRRWSLAAATAAALALPLVVGGAAAAASGGQTKPAPPAVGKHWSTAVQNAQPVRANAGQHGRKVPKDSRFVPQPAFRSDVPQTPGDGPLGDEK